MLWPALCLCSLDQGWKCLGLRLDLWAKLSSTPAARFLEL